MCIITDINLMIPGLHFGDDPILKIKDLITEPQHCDCLGESGDTVKPVFNDHLSNKIYYPWFIQ